MGSHINRDGKFQSDKYPSCPPGKVPLSVEDPRIQDLLLEVARRWRNIDEEFSRDLEDAVAKAIADKPLEWTLCRLHGRTTRTGSCDSCVGDRNLIQVVPKNDLLDTAHDVSIRHDKLGWEAGRRDALRILTDMRSREALRSTKHDVLNSAVHLVESLTFKGGG